MPAGFLIKLWRQIGENTGMIVRRTAIKNDLLAGERRAEKVDALGDPLRKIEAVVEFRVSAQAVEEITPRPEQPKGGRPPIPSRPWCGSWWSSGCIACLTSRLSSICSIGAAFSASAAWNTPSKSPTAPRSGTSISALAWTVSRLFLRSWIGRSAPLARPGPPSPWA